MAFPGDWTECWLVVVKTMTGVSHQLISKDPRLVMNPSGVRKFPDHQLVFYTQLTEAEYGLGLGKLIEIYQQGRKFQGDNPNREYHT